MLNSEHVKNKIQKDETMKISIIDYAEELYNTYTKNLKNNM